MTKDDPYRHVKMTLELPDALLFYRTLRENLWASEVFANCIADVAETFCVECISVNFHRTGCRNAPAGYVEPMGCIGGPAESVADDVVPCPVHGMRWPCEGPIQKTGDE